MRSTFVILTIALALVLGPVSAGAPKAKDQGDKIVLENDHLSVWFQGKKPMLKLFRVGNDTGVMSYTFKQLVEYRDVDADGIPSEQEIVARLDLEKASAFEVAQNETPNGAVLNLSLKAAVKVGGNASIPVVGNASLPDHDAIVSLVFGLRDADATINVSGVDVPVSALSIKYDLAVQKWPWVDAQNDRLGLDMRVTGDTSVGDLAAKLGTATVTHNGTAAGVLSWTSTAQGRTADGKDVDVPVKAQLKAAGADADGNTTRVVFTYDAPGLATLVHDPTIGLASTSASGPAGGVGETISNATKGVPAAGVLAVVGAGALVALASRRR